MLVNGQHFRTIWLDEESPARVKIIDQRRLPFEFVIETLATVEDAARAIREMHVRGAGLIGAAAAFGMYLATQAAVRDEPTFWQSLNQAAVQLEQTRPTAVNLKWAVSRMLQRLHSLSPGGAPATPKKPSQNRLAQSSVVRAELSKHKQSRSPVHPSIPLGERGSFEIASKLHCLCLKG